MFEKLVTPGLPITEIQAKANELNADRIEVFGDEDIIGNKRPPFALVKWRAYHFWPAQYVCRVALNQGKVESVKCGGDFM